VPPAQRPATAATTLLVGGILLAGTAGLVACGVPPELRDPHPPVPPTTRSATPGFGESTATDCQGNPTGEQVIALVRRSPHLLPAGVAVSVRDRPLCAGTWQYTVIQVPGHEPLQVVSNGPARSLTLVTAGTDVCSIPVRTGAPPGIRAVACSAPL
jgi:hypothetical protein